jgi:8-oxo-dGTP diphosphatase
MTSRSSLLRRLAYRVFRSLPAAARRGLVRQLTPNYTLGAVVLVRDPAGSLLLVRQPSSAGWSLPGGLLERNETPAEAAARELAEETGVVVPAASLRPAEPNARVSSSAQQVDLVFSVELGGEAPELRLDPVEVAEAAWHSPGELPVLTPATARLLGAYGLGPLAAGQPKSRSSAAEPAPEPEEGAS